MPSTPSLVVCPSRASWPLWCLLRPHRLRRSRLPSVATHALSAVLSSGRTAVAPLRGVAGGKFLMLASLWALALQRLTRPLLPPVQKPLVARTRVSPEITPSFYNSQFPLYPQRISVV